MVSLLFVIPTTVKAYEDTFTTTDGVVVKKIIEGYTQGNIHFDISNIGLDDEKSYKWAIIKSSNSENIKEWTGLNDVTASKKVATIDLTISNSKHLDLLRSTDEAYLYIKCTEDDKMIVDALKLDLSLPIVYAFKLSKDTGWSRCQYNVSYNGSSYATTSTYKIKDVYYKFEKITDETLINTYQTAISSNSNMNDVIKVTKEDIKNITGWTLCDESYSSKIHTVWNNNSWPTEQGVYYLYLKAKDLGTKTVYGCLVVNVDGDGPKVKSIRVVRPTEGTYDAPQTVKINVYFDETITATQVPTLKIKFGSGSERTISEGTIYNTYNSHYIEYLYNIQSTDKGQIATVSYEGGDVKDTSGNSATLSCPVITGNVIKANESGKDTNQTDNKDKNNNLTNPTPTPTATPTATPAPSSTPKPSTTPTPTSNVKNNNNNNSNNNSNKNDDDTIAPSKLPKTGAGMLLISAVVAISISGVIAYIKVNKYRDID